MKRRRLTLVTCNGQGAGLSLRGCFGTGLLLLLLLLASTVSAQTQTAVSGTVTDPHNLVYAGATISWKLVTSGGGTPSLTPCTHPDAGCQIAAAGGPFPLAPTTTITGTGLAAPPAGSFSMSLWANASILPASSTYSFFISIPGVAPPWGTGPQSCGIAGVTISGTSMDIGAALSAACPPLTPPFGGGTPGSIVCSPGPCLNNFFTTFNTVGAVTNVTNGPCAIETGVMVCSTPLDVQNNGYGIEKPNSASGTTCGLSLSFDAAGNAIVTPNGATVGSEGVAVTTQPGVNASGQIVQCGTSGQVFIGQLGNFSLTFDNQTVIRDFVTIGANGQFHDAGTVQPTGVEVLGRVTSLNAGAGTNANADIFTGDSVANNAPKGKGTVCEVNGVTAPGADCNFNDTTPAAITNRVNTHWQSDTGNPDTNVSNSVDAAQSSIPGVLELNTDLCNTYTAPNVCGFHGHAYTETSLAAKDVICAISAIAYANCKAGVIPRLVTGASDTVLSTDRGGWILTTNAGAVAETVPTAASLGGSNFYFNVTGNGGGTTTLTFSGSETVTLNGTSASASSTLAIASGTWCNITSDTSGTANWYADCAGTVSTANRRRTCNVLIGANNGAALVNADLGPQTNQCKVPAAGTIVEITWSVNNASSTTSIQLQKRHCATFTAGSCTAFTVTNLLSGALSPPATANADACATPTISQTCIDGTTSSGTITVSATALGAGDWIETASGTADTVTTRGTAAVTWTVN